MTIGSCITYTLYQFAIPNFNTQHLSAVFTAVCSDFIEQYQDNAKHGYENVQVAMFYGITEYVHKPGHKRDVVQALFMDVRDGSDKRMFPSIYHAMCDAFQSEIVHVLSEDKFSSETSIRELISEDDAQLLRMHGLGAL